MENLHLTICLLAWQFMFYVLFYFYPDPTFPLYFYIFSSHFRRLRRVWTATLMDLKWINLTSCSHIFILQYKLPPPYLETTFNTYPIFVQICILFFLFILATRINVFKFKIITRVVNCYRIIQFLIATVLGLFEIKDMDYGPKLFRSIGLSNGFYCLTG